MAGFDESNVIRRCREGDERAFAELVDQFKHLVYGLVGRTVPDRSRIDDLAQEVFLRVYRGLPYFRGDSRLSTWIYRITFNVCQQERAPSETVSLDDATARGARRVEPAERDRAFADLELRERLEKALACLPADARFLIAGHYLEGVRYEDLAEALNLPLGTVKTHLHRAKRRLRELLESELG